ncbi:Outer membrane receptor proteins, mostly Fe transport [Catalinimonas alkaloidigena]|uniref:Outer membrane receptor proteins, mostly Fe transport n=1 Tax=Catalinimonas alkaloidigena TaxID=1075417 RepID=A0A1G9GKW0_9BACT|nr:TonB-dependent receptor [Catalinimonas alkaloidigena]SDL01309.1 Outer membrane receptor proteins, mostly Fe transport [Catalinimonas alkaloidigena]
MKRKPFLLLLLLLLVHVGYAQHATQTIRGTLKDQDSQTPLVGATVRILQSDPVQGAVTDLDGNFRIENVPVGRVSLWITYTGYEERVVSNLLVTAAKEVILNVPMQESVASLDEVVVTSETNQGDVLNDMALVSARSFSVEETQRYAGSINDPARMVASFAGVTGNAEGNNDIVVRGNSPKGILWRLEGVETPNPNHFASEGATGGPINALNSNMLDNSDFFSGAFPAEYGNALSGVFDMRFKKGNNEQREFTLGASMIGLDVTAEGPFSKQYGGSYIANYRYSALQLFSEIGILDYGGVPKYQDASFNVELPVGKKNVVTVYGLGGLSSIHLVEENDEEKPLNRYEQSADLGVLGLTHTWFLNEKSFLSNALTASGTRMGSVDDLPAEAGGFYNVSKASINKSTYRLSSTYDYKWSAKHKFQVGAIYSQRYYNALATEYNFETDQTDEVLSDKGSTYTWQAFGNWKFRMNEQWTLTSGLHYLYFGLNGSGSVEPRVGLRWDATPKHSFTAGFGLHSRLESISIYLAKAPQADGALTTPNRSLQPTKAAHLVLGYNYQLNPLTHFKVEAYYQHLYQVPIDPTSGSTFSLLNETEDFVTRRLVNEGTGRNYGLEFTLERSFQKGFYYMTTLSLYRSLYTPQDGVERNTAFAGNYVANLLGGKEFTLGKPAKNRVLFINTKIGLIGGARYTPINLSASQALGTEVRDELRPYGNKGDDVFFLNLAVGIRRNRKNTTHEWKLDVTNLTNNQALVNEYYQPVTGQIEGSPQLSILPNIIYTFKF